MIEPAVCVPSASGASPAATAAPDPLDDPPGVWLALCGLRVGPAVMLANSVLTVLPSTHAPAARASETQPASICGTWPA